MICDLQENEPAAENRHPVKAGMTVFSIAHESNA
jgi:hypothetical protein